LRVAALVAAGLWLVGSAIFFARSVWVNGLIDLVAALMFGVGPSLLEWLHPPG
jgi:hypothetical protein